MNEDRLGKCVDAVEQSNYSAAALDSRALAHLRMGDLAAAQADLDAALLSDPHLAPSRLLRGIVRETRGDRGGREEIELALRMQPSLAATYRAWGLEF
jgi:Tfp pilus assembly protein PilF